MSEQQSLTGGELGRRDFIRRLGAGAATIGGAGLVSGSLAAEPGVGAGASCSPNTCDYDVVIIGGGFAGVTAARDLSKDGFRTVILEARNRLGGRTFTSEFEGHRVELGGTWIHWSQPFVWAEKERYALALAETPGAAPERMILWDGTGRTELEPEQLARIVDAYNRFGDDAYRILDRPYDLLYRRNLALEADRLSARDRLVSLDLPPLEYTALDGILGTMCHNTSDQMSYLDALRWIRLPGNEFNNFMDSAARYKFADGTQALLDRMLGDTDSDVRLGMPVARIEDTGAGVRVTGQRGDSVTAGAAVIALPMNVMADIEFAPALDASLLQAAREQHTGTGYKMYIRVRGQLGNVMTLGRSTEALAMTMTYAQGDDHTLLVAFGPHGTGLDIYDDGAVQAALRNYLPGVEVESTFSYDWVLDPYSKGTYACYRPGWADRYLDHFQQDRGNLYFAQGDHGEGWRGFIDGAIGAGTRAAQRIRTRFGAVSPTSGDA